MRYLIHAKTWMHLENIMLSERSQTQRSHVVRFHLYEISRTGKPVLTDSRLVVDRDWG